MDTDALIYFCTNTLHGQTVKELFATWEKPGYIQLTPLGDPLWDSMGGAAYITATPDFINGRPNYLLFSVNFDGRSYYLPGKTVTWREDTAVATWKHAVLERLLMIRRALTVIRESGTEGFERFVKEHN